LKINQWPKENLKKKIDILIEPARLFIHTTLNYLAKSTDGLISKNAIIEIKCPQSIKEYTPEEAAVNHKTLKCMEIRNGKLVLKIKLYFMCMNITYYN